MLFTCLFVISRCTPSFIWRALLPFSGKKGHSGSKDEFEGGEISVKISYGMENATDEEGGKSALFHYISRMGSCFSRIIFVYLDV